MGDLVADVAAVADLDNDAVEVDDRMQRLERPVLPRQHLVGHVVGDLRDRLMRQFGADRRDEVMTDVTDRHPAGIERHDHRVEPLGTSIGVNVPFSRTSRDDRPRPPNPRQ